MNDLTNNSDKELLKSIIKKEKNSFITSINNIEFVYPKSNESFVQNIVKNSNFNNYNGYVAKVSYISDLHLNRKKLNGNNITSIKDRIDEIAQSLSNEDLFYNSKIKLIAGDICSNFFIYDYFIKQLNINNYGLNLFYTSYQNDYFITLGNHELWPFKGYKLDSIIEIYRNLLKKNKLHLVHNNLYYYEYPSLKEIKTDELIKITEESLREITRGAQIIIFGGIGFSGQNELFNANNGIYQEIINREEEKNESHLFYLLYKKVCNALYDKNVIVLTHMPFSDWSEDKDYFDKFIYVSGHNHENKQFDDGIKRVYADNQIGYETTNFSYKDLYISRQYDWFNDFNDGKYEISRDDYFMFYRGFIGEGISFKQSFKNLYMLKRNSTYLFIMRNLKGKLLILNGGKKYTAIHDIDYYYNNMVKYSISLKKYLTKFNSTLEMISKKVKIIGGSGRIHGCIVDIDFYNHLYVNPFDGNITPYYALSTVDKTIYKNIEILLKEQCPQVYNNYKKMIGKGKNDLLVLAENSNLVESDFVKYEDTKMYHYSNTIFWLNYICKYNIIRKWNDEIVDSDVDQIGNFYLNDIIDNQTE